MSAIICFMVFLFKFLSFYCKTYTHEASANRFNTDNLLFLDLFDAEYLTNKQFLVQKITDFQFH